MDFHDACAEFYELKFFVAFKFAVPMDERTDGRTDRTHRRKDEQDARNYGRADRGIDEY